MVIKTLTVNVRGLGNHIKWRTLFQFFKKEKCDTICLQEAHVTSKCADIWKWQWSADFYFSEASSHGKWQIIMINKKLGATHCQQLRKDERIIGIKFNVDDKMFYVFNVYVPSTDYERTFFSHLWEWCCVSVEDNAQGIIAGDFNVVSSNDLDIISGNPHNAKSADSFNATMAKLNVFDCWWLFHSDEKQYTWNRNNPSIAHRLDNIFGNSSLLDKLVRSDIVPFPCTDHRGVVTESIVVHPTGNSVSTSYMIQSMLETWIIFFMVLWGFWWTNKMGFMQNQNEWNEHII